ncbi:hypothetical protein QN395_15230 [Undibacterium sp. RTI2.2]|nr:hypothetical protein [Undibacterium sp. RTI2.2]
MNLPEDVIGDGSNIFGANALAFRRHKLAKTVIAIDVLVDSLR